MRDLAEVKVKVNGSDLAMSAEKESSDVPESLAGGSGTSGDDFDRRVKSLVEEILRGQMTRTPAPRPGKSTGKSTRGAVAGMWHICCIIVVVSSVCLY